MKPQDHVIYRYNCRIYAEFEHRTMTSPEKNYGTGTTIYKTVHNTGWEAVEALIKYCTNNGIQVEQPSDEWRVYFERMDSHIKSMEAKIGTMSQSSWDIAMSANLSDFTEEQLGQYNEMTLKEIKLLVCSSLRVNDANQRIENLHLFRVQILNALNEVKET